MTTFTTTLWSPGGNNVGIVVPEDVVLSFGRGKRVPVIVTVDGGYRYPNTIASMGGRYLISFNAETRRATGKGAGDEIEVMLEVDDSPRTVTPPDALAAAFAAEPELAGAWERLAPSRQKAHAASVTDARTEETRQRRIEKIVAELRPRA